MADGGVTSKHSKTKWILLSKIKSTVHVLLENRNSNIWSTYGGLNRIIDDLERIFRHNLKSHKDFFGKPIDYDVVLKNAGILGGNYTGKIWLKETLTQHTFMSQLTYIIENKPLIKEFYQDTAFLRSPDYCKALLICIEAVETNSPGIITQLNDIVVQKDRIYGQDMERESFQDNHIPKTMDNEISYETEKSPKNIQELPETERPLLTTNYNGEQDEKTSDIKGFIAVEERLSAEEEECCDGGDLEIEETPVATNGANTMTTLNTDLLKNHDIHLAKEKLQIKELKLATSKKRKHNIDQGTLAQVALTAVMEGDERCVSPSSCWFEGTSTCSQRKQSTSLSDSDLKDLQKEDDVDSTSKIQDNKRTSQHSLDSFMDSKLQINCLNSKQTSNSQHSLDSIIPSRSDYKSMKAHGHSRSRSDGTRLIKNTVRQHSMKEMSSHKKQHTKSISENSSRLSSSLPEKESSVEFYHNDPLSPHEEVTSYASMLALQDLSSCELEKENAHFSISEALIQAIEQMKCDQIIASEDDEEDDDDDEEIQHLKQEIERRRLEKKREKLRLEGAFSDETPKSASNQSSTSDHSTRSSSSKSSCVDIDDIDPDWEQISQEHVHNLSNLSASETTLVPEIHPAVLDVSSMESSASPPLSAEAVAKSLLQKFANKKHPAASELQWLVSENDVPQSLLPLPKAFSVDPEEGIRNVDDGRKTLPCRMRGNLEWAPPRFQIIFHIPPQPRRRQLMAEQNYRCVGCGMQVDPGYMKRFRYCHYLGKYACSSCHNNALMIIPARVIRRWDFKKYEVSKFACDLLNKIHADPLFNIQDLNRSLYDKVRILEIMKNLRKQLYFLRSFAQTCRKSQHLQLEFSHIPDHLLSEEHLYSLQDLIQVKSGELPTYFKSLVSQCLQHIGECPLCQAKGFICEYCRNGDDIIFPYELDRVIQCKNCRASFHKDCYVEGKCPKCERIQIRKSLMAASLPPEA